MDSIKAGRYQPKTKPNTAFKELEADGFPTCTVCPTTVIGNKSMNLISYRNPFNNFNKESFKLESSQIPSLN